MADGIWIAKLGHASDTDIGYPSKPHDEFSEYFSSAQIGSCPSLASSFPTLDSSSFSFDAGDSSLSSISPYDFGNSISPITPTGSITEFYDNSAWPKEHPADICTQPTAAPRQIWLQTRGACAMNNSSNSSYDMLASAEKFLLPVKQLGPALSRNVFSEPTPMSYELVDLPCLASQPSFCPQTIEPQATFQQSFSSSSHLEYSPVTPQHSRDNSCVFSSSPLAAHILLSQHDSDAETSCQMPPSIWPKQDWTPVKASCLRSSSELLSSPMSSKDSKFSRSGIDCEPRIAPNDHPCTWPGCVDKEGRVKRFKRQEHRKRHEKTVHLKQAVFRCWVVTGHKACAREFTRRDNLHSHLKKTHGRRSNNQRNSYVATLDEKSKYFDPEYRGKCTGEGLPVGHPRWPELNKLAAK